MKLLLAALFIVGFSSVTWAGKDVTPHVMPPDVIKCSADHPKECQDDRKIDDEIDKKIEDEIDDKTKGEEDLTMCTMDAKQCPDGSFVSRMPPNCEFAPCPDSE